MREPQSLSAAPLQREIKTVLSQGAAQIKQCKASYLTRPNRPVHLGENGAAKIATVEMLLIDVFGYTKCSQAQMA